MSFKDTNVLVCGARNYLDGHTLYTTVIPKPTMDDNRIVLTQDMMSKKNTKYIIKWNFVLGEDITVPKNCLIEFDGGSISNDNGENFSLTGQDTYLLFDLPIEEVLKVPLLGTFIYGVEKDKIDNIDGMAKIYLKRDKSLAEQIDAHHGGKPNTIYVIRYDFTLDDDVTIPENCVLEFDGGSISGAHILSGNNTRINRLKNAVFLNGVMFSGSWHIDILNVDMFAHSSTPSNNAWIVSAVNSIVNNEHSKVNAVEFTNGMAYEYTSGFVFKNSVEVYGNNATINFHLNGSYCGFTFAKDSFLQKDTATSISATKDSYTISASGHGINAGDLILLHDNTDYSYASDKAYYHKGDIFKVVSVTNGSIIVSEALTDDYSGSNMEIYKINPIKGTISDINLGLDSDNNYHVNGIQIFGGNGFVVNNITASGTWNCHIMTELSYKNTISNCKIDYESNVDNANALKYGIFVGSSKDIVVSGNICKTSRHGIVFGGANTSYGSTVLCIPNRRVIVTKNIVDSCLNVGSLNCHPNVEDILIIGNSIYNGFSFEGRKGVIESNYFSTCNPGRYGIYCCSNNENVDIHNNVFESRVSDVYGILIADFNSNRNPIINIKSNIFKIAGSSIRLGTDKVSELNVTDNQNIISGTFFDNAIVNETTIMVVGNVVRGNFIYHTSDKAFAGDVHIINNSIKTRMNVISTGSVEIKGNYIDKPPLSGFYIQCLDSEASPKCDIIENVIVGFIDYGSSTFKILQVEGSEVNFIRNTFINEINPSDMYDYVLDAASTVIARDNIIKSVSGVYRNNNGTLKEQDIHKAVPTSDRPNSVEVGDSVFDSTLNKPIYWTGTSWVDATGTPPE